MFTDAIADHLQNFTGVQFCQNKGNLEKMKLGLLTFFLHVASSKVTGLDRWCKFNEDKVNKMNTLKPGPGLSNEVIYKFKPIYLKQRKWFYKNANYKRKF